MSTPYDDQPRSGEHGLSGPAELAYPFPDFPPPVPRRPLGPTLRAAAFGATVIALCGVPLGLLWRWIAPDVPVVLTRIGPYPADAQPEQFVAADALFAMFGFGFGVAASAIAWWLLRRHRGPVVLAAVVVGALAAGVVAWQAGRWWGHADFAHWAASGALGSRAQQPTDLRAYGVLLVPAFASVIAYTLLAGWSHDPELSPDVSARDLGIDSGDPGRRDEPVSSGWPGGQAPTAAPAPPAPGAAAPPHG